MRKLCYTVSNNASPTKESSYDSNKNHLVNGKMLP